MTDYNQIIDFWVHEVGPAGWYQGTTELDENIRQKFMKPWQAALNGEFQDWKNTPDGSLAYLILTDQFPRNMFRESAQAFATDPLARSVAIHSTDAEFDLQIDTPTRQFFYLPFEHSEEASDQERAVSLLESRMSDFDDQILHARTHQEIIYLYGRFPFRNKALGRKNTEAEDRFFEERGYQGVLERLKAQS